MKLKNIPTHIEGVDLETGDIVFVVKAEDDLAYVEMKMAVSRGTLPSIMPAIKEAVWMVTEEMK